jgi:hypothetical protein
MDNDQQVRAIELRLDALEGMPIRDDRSAREAFTHAMVTVSQINHFSSRTQAQAIMGAATPVDDLFEKLRVWIDRLVTVMRRIVAKLAGATAFSVSAGTSVSITVDFGPTRARSSFLPGRSAGGPGLESSRPYGPGLT